MKLENKVSNKECLLYCLKNKIKISELKLHVIQLATSNSRNRGRLALENCTSDPPNLHTSISGYLYGLFDKDYTVAFISAGIPPIVGAIFMCLIYWVKSPATNSGSSVDVSIEVLDENELKSSKTSPTMVQSLTATTTLSVETNLLSESQSLLVNT